MSIKQTLDSAGISAAEFGALVGVSKNMVYKWIKGASPHALRVTRVDRLLKAIDNAVASGDFPLIVAETTRAKQIQAVVLTNLKKDV